MIVGTAGHIDHGKTTLVRALTGVDTDRLPEEKRRGITIALGFAPLELPGVGVVGVVDVPGHEGFVRTMLAGATGVDVALLVIAADEGVMPQTREHLAILDLLGVRAGVVALSKADAADDEWMRLVEDDVRALLAGTTLADAPVVRCSAASGAGLDSLREALAAAVASVPARSTDAPFRLPVDRAFSVTGVGTVVTGTVWSGTLGADEPVRVLPAGIEARVRGIEQHGRPVARAEPASRAAIALVGVERAAIDGHGAVVVRAGDHWPVATRFRADVTLASGAPTLGPRTRVRLHLGTADVAARLVSAEARVRPGATVPVRVVVDAPVVVRSGDRFVLRTTSPAATIGGGIVRDPAPPPRRVKPFPAIWSTAAEQLGWMLDEAAGQGVATGVLPARLGVSAGEAAVLAKKARAVAAADRWFAADVVRRAGQEVGALVRRAHVEQPLEPGVPVQRIRSVLRVHEAVVDAAIAAEVAAGRLTLAAGVVARTGFVAGGDALRNAEVLDAVKSGGATPPSVEELQVRFGKDVIAVLKHLERQGAVVAVSLDRYYGIDAVAALEAAVVAFLAGKAGASASELREALGVTRKYLIPFLEYCDRRGITVRRGDDRVRGPTAPRQAGAT